MTTTRSGAARKRSTRSRFVRSETVRTRAARRTARGTSVRKIRRSVRLISSGLRSNERSWTVTTPGHGVRSGSTYCVCTSPAPSLRSRRGSESAMRSSCERPRSSTAWTPPGTRSGRRVTAAMRMPASAASGPSSRRRLRTYVSSPVRSRPSTSASMTTGALTRAPGRLRLPPGRAELRRGLTTLAARGSSGPYHSYCALRPRTASAAPGTRGRGGLTRGGSCELPPERFDAVGGALPGELAGARESERHELVAARLRLRDPGGDRGGIERVDEHRGTAGHLLCRAPARGHRGRSARHRLENRDAEPLVERRKNEAARPSVERRELGVRDLADPAGDVDSSPAARADDAELHFREPSGLDDPLEVLPRLQRRDGENVVAL